MRKITPDDYGSSWNLKGTNYIVTIVNYDASTDGVHVKPLDGAAIWAYPRYVFLDRFEELPKDANTGIVGVAMGRIETVNHPQHYGGDTTYEAIKVIEAWDLGFCLGNAVKYICRAGKKGDPISDLKKAVWYLNREIEKLQSEVVPDWDKDNYEPTSYKQEIK